MSSFPAKVSAITLYPFTIKSECYGTILPQIPMGIALENTLEVPMGITLENTLEIPMGITLKNTLEFAMGLSNLIK